MLSDGFFPKLASTWRAGEDSVRELSTAAPLFGQCHCNKALQLISKSGLELCPNIYGKCIGRHCWLAAPPQNTGSELNIVRK